MEKEDRLLKDVFILRLWWNVKEPLLWRGEVQHVNSGDIQHVHSAGDLLDYLQQRLLETREWADGEKNKLH